MTDEVLLRPPRRAPSLIPAHAGIQSRFLPFYFLVCRRRPNQSVSYLSPVRKRFKIAKPSLTLNK